MRLNAWASRRVKNTSFCATTYVKDIFEAVTRESRYGQRLHKRNTVRQNSDSQAEVHLVASHTKLSVPLVTRKCCVMNWSTNNAFWPRAICGNYFSEEEIGQDVIESEVKVSPKKHCDRNAVDVVCFHCVFCPQHIVEVVCVPVVSDKGKRCYPNCCFDTVTLTDRNAGFARNAREKKWL